MYASIFGIPLLPTLMPESWMNFGSLIRGESSRTLNRFRPQIVTAT